MAVKQTPVAAFPFPALVAEVGTRQAPISTALVAETVSVSPPAGAGTLTQVFVAT